MHYRSTRDSAVTLTAAEAIARGLSHDGGLFVPERLPALSGGDIEALAAQTYQERAACIMKLFLDDFTQPELLEFADNAYLRAAFDHQDIAPVRTLDESTHFLELWHGPTCAFKDMALQMLPHLLTAGMRKTGENRDVCILVATSGDTGKAALEGFKDVPRTRIMVFYPKDGVSDVQKLQMVTQEGGNVGVCAVAGNFDDAQTGVKQIFSDEALRGRLDQRGCFLSSANSINWGRLLPQIVYYVSAYCDLVKNGNIALGDQINFCVPTGNFGNILAGYYAKKMGLPINRLICASNCNDVLTEFIGTGAYNRNRSFYTTISPSMDILVSSNLERLLYDVSGGDAAAVSGFMSQLSLDGRYDAGVQLTKAVARVFSAGWCSDRDTRAAVGEVYRRFGYLIDTHTAVAYHVLGAYRASTGDMTPAVVVSTASPFKFCGSVLEGLGENTDADGLALIDRLSAYTGIPAPAPLSRLRGKPVRFERCVEKEEMPEAVKAFLFG